MNAYGMNELLLGVFFESTDTNTNHLYVSFDGYTFRKISQPYTDAEAGSANKKLFTAFRDPGFIYHDGRFWILNGKIMENQKDGSTNVNKYQPMWGASKGLDLTAWSGILSGNATSNNPISLNCNGAYPYDKNGQLRNKTFDACGPDVFVDGENIYIFLSAGYWGQWHSGDFNPDIDGISLNERDIMKQYLIKVNQLRLASDNSTLQVNYAPAKMVNFPKLQALYDERNERRGGNNNLYKEDRIDGSLYIENGKYYFAVKRFGTTYELWQAKNLENVSSESNWTLINSDFVHEYEGASLVKFKGKYLFYCDELSDTHGIHVAVANGLGTGDRWKLPERVKFIESKNDQIGNANRRHGTVLCIKDDNLITAILNTYKAKYNSVKDEPLNVDMRNGWFRSNGKLYYCEKGSWKASCEWQHNGDWYWFDADGSMARNKFVYIPNHNKWVYYNHEGKMAKGEMRIGNSHNYWDLTPQNEYHWYYFELDTGERATSKFVYLPAGDRWVYYDSNGWMVYGEQKINNNWYYFDTQTGKMAKGWVTLPDGSRHHYDETTGIRIE